MSDADLLKTYKLAEYIVKQTNIIGRPFGDAYGTSFHISQILNITEKTTREYLSRVISLGILANLDIEKGNSSISCYAFNPLYVNSCRYVPPIIYYAFKDQLDEVTPEWLRIRYEHEIKARNIGP